MGNPWLRQRGEAIEIDVMVVPRASRNELVGIHEDRLKIRLAAPPVEGKANKELIRFLSKQLSVPRSRIELVTGERGRRKAVKVSHMTCEAVLEQLRQVIGDLD